MSGPYKKKVTFSTPPPSPSRSIPTTPRKRSTSDLSSIPGVFWEDEVEVYSSERDILEECLLRQHVEDSSDSLGGRVNLYRTAVMEEVTAPLSPCIEVEVIVVNDDMVTISILGIEGLPGGSLSSLGEGKLTFSSRQATIIAHEFTFGCFGVTDVKLSDYFKAQEDLVDLTPDFIFQSLGWIHVVEFATCSSMNDDAFKNTMNFKLAKYQEALMLRAAMTNLHVSLDVIVVGRNKIMSTLELPERLKVELVQRFQISKLAEEPLEKLGIVQSHLKEKMDYVEHVSEVLKTVPLEFKEGFAEYTEENYEYWRAPMDWNYIQRLIMKKGYEAMEVVANEAMLPDLERGEVSAKVNRMAKDHFYSDNIRKDRKAIVQLPLWCLKPRPEPSTSLNCPWLIFTRTEDDDLPDELSYLRTLWPQAKNEIALAPERFEDPNEEREVQIAMGEYEMDEELMKKERRMFRRVKLVVPEEEAVKLAKIGLDGKSMKDNPVVKEYRERKKASFSLDSPTEDVESYQAFCHESLTRQVDNPTMESYYVLKLIDDALGLSGGSLTCAEEHPMYGMTETLKDFLNTAYYTFHDMISAIGVELNISLKQNVHKNEYVIKKLKNYNLFMLIKPTRGSSHIFVSFACRQGDIISGTDSYGKELGWKRFHKMGDMYVTDFVSFSGAKLENITKAGPLCIAMFSQWAKFYELDVSRPIEADDLPANFWQMHGLSMMLGLNDKHQAEEICSQFRYASMEGFKAWPTKRESRKVIKKFPKRLRSRLEVWLVKKIINEIINIDSIGYTLTVSEETHESMYVGMRNPYTMEILKNPSQLLDLMYIGYVRNKDENGQKNSEWLLLDKIMTEELIFRQDPRKELLGCKDPEDMLFPTHHYSVEFAKLKARCYHEHAQRTMGVNYKRVLNEAICKALWDVTYEELASLKASSNFGPDLEEIPEESLQYHRSTVIEAITKIIPEGGSLPFEDFPKVLLAMEQQGCMYICIFKKAQHGGVREIYVLDMKARLIQKFIETIARVLCSTVASETMTHPNKIALMTSHGREVAKVRNSSSYKAEGLNSYNFNLSEDKKRWNQRNSPSKFAVLLVNILDPMFHGMVIRSLRLWKKKKIMMPANIINLIKTHPELRVFDENFGKLISDMMGTTTGATLGIMGPNKTYLNIETGMMQGILHFLSSFDHSCQNLVMDYYVKRMLKRQLGRHVTHTFMQSSDDTAYMLTVHAKDVEFKAVSVWCAWAFSFIQVAGEIGGMYTSTDKSSKLTPQVVEFNSEWVINSQLHKPVLKWIYACLSVQETESLTERQEQMSNLLTQCLESGNPTLSCFVCQVAQASLFYKMLGSSVNPLFEHSVDLLSESKDPGLGFFLMDPMLISGFAGFCYNFWQACQASRLGKRVKLLLEKGNLTSTSAGTIVRGLVMHYGDRNKWKTLMRRVEEWAGFENWVDEVEDDPAVLYQPSYDRRTIALKLLVKLSSPMVVTALSKGNKISKVISSSVYFFNRPALVAGSAWLQVLDQTINRKTSLLQVLNEVLPLEAVGLTEMDNLLIFPFCLDYIKLQSINDTLSKSFFRVWDNVNKKKAIVQIAESLGYEYLSLLSVCMMKWFGIKRGPASDRQLNLMWDRYQGLFPWLKNTARETLAASPFTKQIQLHNFVTQDKKKVRNIRLTAAPLKTREGESTMLSAARRHAWPGLILSNQADEMLSEALRTDEIMAHVSAATYLFPYTKTTKEEVFKEVMQEILTDNPECLDLTRASERLQRLIIIVKFLLNRNGRAEATDTAYKDIEANKAGTVGGWLKPQSTHETGTTVRYYGAGVWYGSMAGLPLRIFVNKDTLVSKIEVPTILRIKDCMIHLRRWCREMKIGMCQKNSVTSPVLCILNWNLVKPGPDGTPIVLKDSSTFLAFDQDADLKFEIGEMSIRLYTEVDLHDALPDARSSLRRVTLVSFKPSELDLKFPQWETTNSRTLFRNWVNMKSIGGQVSSKSATAARDAQVVLAVPTPEYYVVEDKPTVVKGIKTNHHLSSHELTNKAQAFRKATRKPVDSQPEEFWRQVGFKRIRCSPNGDCLYEALVEGLRRTGIEGPATPHQLRYLIKHLLQRREDKEHLISMMVDEEPNRTAQEYFDNIYREDNNHNLQTWGDQLTIQLFAEEYRLPVRVFTGYAHSLLVGDSGDSKPDPCIYVCLGDAHYDLLVPEDAPSFQMRNRRRVPLPEWRINQKKKKITETVTVSHAQELSFTTVINLISAIATDQKREEEDQILDHEKVRKWTRKLFLSSLGRKGVSDAYSHMPPETLSEPDESYVIQPTGMIPFEEIFKHIEDDLTFTKTWFEEYMKEADPIEEMVYEDPFKDFNLDCSEIVHRIQDGFFDILDTRDPYETLTYTVHPMFDNYVNYLEGKNALAFLDQIHSNFIRRSLYTKFPNECNVIRILLGLGPDDIQIIEDVKMEFSHHEGEEFEKDSQL